MPASRYHEAEADAGAALVIRSAHRAPLGGLLLIIAAVWLAPAIGGLVLGQPALVPRLGSVGACLAGAVGAALAVIALDWMVRGHVVVIGRGSVAVTVWSLFGRRAWQEPLADYRLIRTEREQRPHRYGRVSWYVVRLCHAEPGRSVELARAKDPALIARRAQDYAGRLGLPLSCHLDDPSARPDLGRGGVIAPRSATGEPLARG